ncbi:hypothetical protein LBMAG27_12310 [Bacteroidota bacterium]|nr:hypothetical protein LBMAG27_12310 [Bacteroidota bacterium]
MSLRESKQQTEQLIESYLSLNETEKKDILRTIRLKRARALAKKLDKRKTNSISEKEIIAVLQNIRKKNQA